MVQVFRVDKKNVMAYNTEKARYRCMTTDSGLCFKTFIYVALCLTLCGAIAEGSDGAAAFGLSLLLGLGHGDGAKCLLIVYDVLLQGKQQALSVLGSHDDAVAHGGALHTGEDRSEIDNKLRGRVRDKCEA